MIRILQSHRPLTVSGVSERTMFILRVSVLVFMCYSGTFATGGSQLQQQGSYLQQEATNLQASESVPASEVEYVDGPLAPLYDFLIQRRLQKFCKLLREAGLEEVLQSLGGYWTLFVPTDASFLYLPGGTLENLKSNPQQLRDFILYHFVTGDFPSSQILNEMLVDSVQGAPLRFNIYGEITTVSGAQILEPDLEFELGRVHIIDHPLHPIPTTDTVSFLRTSHQRLYRLLLDAGLTDYLSSGPFTILAPNDDAFDFLSVELKDALASNTSLAERVLLNHILPGSLYTGGIVDGMRWDTVGGSVITFTTKRGLIFANGIPIVLPDNPFTNGVVHVLNRVLLPEGVEADCNCKPSSTSKQPSSQVPGGARPPFAQTQRPQSPTRRPNDQYSPRQTPSPFGSQTPGVGPNVSPQRQPISPRLPAQQPQQQPQRPFSPSRSGSPVRPLAPPVQTTRSPIQRPFSQPPSEDDSNTVIGPEFQPVGGQRRPEPSRTTRYPPPPRRGPNIPTTRIPAQPPKETLRGQQPQTITNNDVRFPDQDISLIVTNPPRQTSRWENRQQTQSPRYPTRAQNTVRTPVTTRRPQTTRSYNRPTPIAPNQNGHSAQPFTNSNQQQELQTQRTPASTASWQQRKQITIKPAVNSRTPTPPRIPPPPQPRPIQPRPFSTTQSIVPPVTDGPFESNRQQPTCRRRSDRVIPTNQNLPLCPETDAQGCQNAPYNPSDPRPLCTTSSECRGPNEQFNPSDNRPPCASPAPEQNCRGPGERPYPGDRRPLCSSVSRPTQTGCRDPSTPFSRSDNRPLCPTTSSINNVTPPQEIPQAGCRRSGEPTNAQDRRPLCPPEPQQDCRPFNERPKPGDRRPICNTNRQPIQINPSHVNKGQTPQTQHRPSHSQNNRRPNTQTTRRQSWQQTTRAPQPAIAPVTNSNNQVGQVPPVSVTQQPPFEPQRGSRLPISSRQPQPGSQTQTGYPSPPQSSSYPSQPESGSNAIQPQSPATGSFRPQSGSNAARPEINQFQTPSTRSPQPQSPGSRQPPTLTRPYPPPPRFYPPPPPNFVPQEPPLRSGASSQGPYPRPGATTPSPPSQSFQTSYPVNQPIGPNVGPSGNQQFTPLVQPVSPPRQQTGSVTTYPGRVTTAPRIPVSVTGTSATPGEDTRRTLYEIVEDPSLLIRGSPVKMTKIFSLFHKAGLDDILSGPGPTTVFLPADDAFSLLPKGVVDQLEENVELLRQVLLYHVTNVEVLPNVQGGSYTVPSQEGTQIPITMLNSGRMILISGAKAIAVTRANNGIFYVINQLLYPIPPRNIVQVIQSRPDLSTLSWLLSQSGLTDMLEGETPYTFLAPTDNAFAKLPPDTLEILSQNSTALRELLLNHIVEGAHYGREFLTGGTFPNARGGKLKFQVVSYGYQVNEINIKTPETVTGTGVIHLIDEVILEDSDKRLFNTLDNSVNGLDVTPIDNLQPPANEFLPFDGQPPSPTDQRHGSGQSVPGGPISRRGPSAGQSQNTGLQPPPRLPIPQRPPLIQPQITGFQPPSGQSNSQRTPQGQPQITGYQPPSGQPNSQRTPQGQKTPVTQRPFNRQPQITGYQPPSGQPNSQRTPQNQQTPVTQRPFNRQPQNGVTAAFGGQRQPVTQGFGQPTNGNRRPVSGTQTFTGQRQPSFQPSKVENANGQQANVADLARAMGLNRFANWLTNTGLLEKIHDGGVYTVFAPTDDAVNSLPEDMVYSIDSNPEQTKSLLQYHIIPRRLNLNSVTNEETSSTLLQGKNIRFNVYETVQPNCKQLVTASGTPIGDALATMGSIQVIPVTQVLYQPTGNMLNIIDASPILQSLSQAIKSARINWVLSGSGPLTFFAPSDTAFQSLSPEQKRTLIDDKQAFTELLKRHLVRGTFFSSGVQEDLEKSSETSTPLMISLQEGILTVNSVPVAYSDITATNGVLHVIDQFL